MKEKFFYLVSKSIHITSAFLLSSYLLSDLTYAGKVEENDYLAFLKEGNKIEITINNKNTSEVFDKNLYDKVIVEYIEVNNKDKLVEDILPLVKKYEGFNPKAYKDYKNYINIGYGTLAKGRKTITEKEASKELKTVLLGYLNRLENDYGMKDTPEDIKKAMLSFTYNLGIRKDVIELAKTGNREALAYTMKQYIRAGGEIKRGLVLRRAAEVELFFKK